MSLVRRRRRWGIYISFSYFFPVYWSDISSSLSTDYELILLVELGRDQLRPEDIDAMESAKTEGHIHEIRFVRGMDWIRSKNALTRNGRKKINEAISLATEAVEDLEGVITMNSSHLAFRPIGLQLVDNGARCIVIRCSVPEQTMLSKSFDPASSKPVVDRNEILDRLIVSTKLPLRAMAGALIYWLIEKRFSRIGDFRKALVHHLYSYANPALTSHIVESSALIAEIGSRWFESVPISFVPESEKAKVADFTAARRLVILTPSPRADYCPKYVEHFLELVGTSLSVNSWISLAFTVHPRASLSEMRFWSEKLQSLNQNFSCELNIGRNIDLYTHLVATGNSSALFIALHRDSAPNLISIVSPRPSSLAESGYGLPSNLIQVCRNSAELSVALSLPVVARDPHRRSNLMANELERVTEGGKGRRSPGREQ